MVKALTLTLEEAIARVPHWAGARGLQISSLPGGITNRNYRVSLQGEHFVLRLPGENAELLGIHRAHEHAAHRAAASLGLAPEVVHFIEPEGCLVTRFLDAPRLPPERLREPANIQRVAGALRRVHGIPAVPGVFSPFRTIHSYVATAERFGVPLPENFAWLIGAMKRAEEFLRKNPRTPRPCHNDLLNENFLDSGTIQILDWEYAGMGDVFFDLANLAANHGFEDSEDRCLLQCYFGEATCSRYARLKLMKVISDFREATWGLLQTGISHLSFDFQEYARKHFQRTTGGFADPRFEQWLQDVEHEV